MMFNKKSFKYFVIIIIVVGLAYLFFFSIGKIETLDHVKPNEFKEDRDQAYKRYKAHKLRLNSDQKLKQMLDKKFNRLWSFVKLLILLIYFIPLFLLYLGGFILTVNFMTSYVTFSAMIIGGVYFLFADKTFDLNRFSGDLKIRLKNWVYGKHVNIESRISNNKIDAKNALDESKR